MGPEGVGKDSKSNIVNGVRIDGKIVTLYLEDRRAIPFPFRKTKEAENFHRATLASLYFQG